MSKGDGSSGGALGVGGIAGRAAAFASIVLGGAIVVGAGYAMVRNAAKPSIHVDPTLLTEAMVEHVVKHAHKLNDTDLLVATVTPISMARAIRLQLRKPLRRATAAPHPAIQSSIDKLKKGSPVVAVATGKQLKQALKAMSRKPGPIPTKGRTAAKLKKESLARVASASQEQIQRSVKDLTRKLRQQRLAELIRLLRKAQRRA